MKAFSISVALIFLALIIAATVISKLAIPVFIGYLLLSVATFFMNWRDKSAAQKDTPRTPETTLHLLAVLGGWPGALIGQQLLCHKTQKVAFRVILWLTVIANIGILTGTVYFILPMF